MMQMRCLMIVAAASEIWCVIAVMDCSSMCLNVEKEADELEEVTVARI